MQPNVVAKFRVELHYSLLPSCAAMDHKGDVPIALHPVADVLVHSNEAPDWHVVIPRFSSVSVDIDRILQEIVGKHNLYLKEVEYKIFSFQKRGRRSTMQTRNILMLKYSLCSNDISLTDGPTELVPLLSYEMTAFYGNLPLCIKNAVSLLSVLRNLGMRSRAHYQAVQNAIVHCIGDIVLKAETRAQAKNNEHTL
eukprot:IDg1662t1